jgi:CRISPR/Cas system-associated protein Cas7 (RAMP superfamily)
MDLHKMIAELQEEKHRLDEAIEALERLSTGGQKRRGRPPKWLNSDAAGSAEKMPNPAPAKKQA